MKQRRIGSCCRIAPVVLALGIAALFRANAAAEDEAIEAVPITNGPGYHWFGYYDKLQFDPANRFVLGMKVDFEHRSPGPEDVIEIGMVDLERENEWIRLGESRSWGWQQGCMLQWRPGSTDEVLWNDREGDRFVCRVLNVKTKEAHTLPHAVYAVSPDGKTAVTADFRRINDMRPGYGYAGLPDPNVDKPAPVDSGIYRVDLDTGERDLIVSLAAIRQIPLDDGDFAGTKHYFNHLLVDTRGDRFIFLHRWRGPDIPSFMTRMFTAALDGSNIRLVDPSGFTSHFIWRSDGRILAWTRHPSRKNAFYLFEDKKGGAVDVVGKDVMTRNGHCTYLPGEEWILNDTYPMGTERLQRVYLYHVPTGREVTLGEFHSPREYSGEWRCDTHPRSSRDGRYVVIDSPHGGNGRQMYLMDISGITQSNR